jgi:hypothetical protein
VVVVPEDASGQSFTCENCQQPFAVPEPLRKGEESQFPTAERADESSTEQGQGGGFAGDSRLAQAAQSIQQALAGIPIIGRLVQAFEPMRRGLDMLTRSLFRLDEGSARQEPARDRAEAQRRADRANERPQQSSPTQAVPARPALPGTTVPAAGPAPNKPPPVAPVAGGTAQGGEVASAGVAAGGGASPWAAVAAGLGGVAMAATGAVQAMQAIVGMATQFVQAFNPTVMTNFNWVVRELSATIGKGLLPIVVVAADYLRDLADMLLPVMEAVQDGLGQVAAVAASMSTAFSEMILNVIEAFAPIAEVLQTVFEAFTSIQKAVYSLINVVAAIVEVILTALAPWLTVFAGILQVVANFLEDFMRVFQAVARALSKALGFGLGADFQAGVQGIVKAIREVTTRLFGLGLSVALVVGKLLGLSKDFGRDLIQGLQGRERTDSTGISAATNGQVTSADSIGRTLAAAAFTATATGFEVEKPEDPFKQVIANLKQLNEQTKEMSLQKVIAEGIRMAASGAGSSVTNTAIGTLMPGLGFVLGVRSVVSSVPRA